MSATWLIVLGSAAALIALLALAAALFAQRNSEHVALAKRIGRLSLRNKARLASALARDRRIPLVIRGVPAFLVLYLAMPLDLIPDFLPVVGQLDDLLIVGLGVWLLFRFVPRAALLEHIERLEAAQSRSERGGDAVLQ
jgi:uncharacterized membrane protein YkvA (DUF1232 family)